MKCPSLMFRQEQLDPGQVRPLRPGRRQNSRFWIFFQKSTALKYSICSSSVFWFEAASAAEFVRELPQRVNIPFAQDQCLGLLLSIKSNVCNSYGRDVTTRLNCQDYGLLFSFVQVCIACVGGIQSHSVCQALALFLVEIVTIASSLFMDPFQGFVTFNAL